MRHFPIGLSLVVATSFAVQAHVRVQPAQSQPGVRQTYSVRVPTEGKIATTALVLLTNSVPPEATNTSSGDILRSEANSTVAS
jgi:uncharacterized protein YcnI